MKESFIIAKKEFIEIFRGKIYIILMIIPVFVFPLFNILTSQMETVSSKIIIGVCIDNNNFNDDLSYYLSKIEDVECELLFDDEPEKLLKMNKIDFYINVTDGSINFVYDFTSIKSFFITSHIGELFQKEYYSHIGKSHNNVLTVNLLNSSGNLFGIGELSSLIIPILLIMSACQGSTALANNSFVGEKERKTFELLLLSGIKRSNIYYGKCFPLLVLSIINIMLSICSFFITYSLDGSMYIIEFFKNENPSFTVFVIILILILINFLTVFLSVSVSLVSNNYKNAQLINEIILGIPLILFVAISLELISMNNSIMKFFPIINLLCCFCNAFKGIIDIPSLIISVDETLVIIALIIIFSKKYIESDIVMTS